MADEKKTITLVADANQIKMLEKALRDAQFKVYTEQEKARAENNITARESALAKFMAFEDMIQQVTDQGLDELLS
jgi:hypothetical protein